MLFEEQPVAIGDEGTVAACGHGAKVQSQIFLDVLAVNTGNKPAAIAFAGQHGQLAVVAVDGSDVFLNGRHLFHKVLHLAGHLGHAFRALGIVLDARGKDDREGEFKRAGRAPLYTRKPIEFNLLVLHF